jgi:uncharacterized membrane protein YgcG
MRLRNHVARLAVGTLAAAWALGVSTPPVHADEGWTINSFHADVKIETDSTLTVTEDIRVDFGSQAKHGIFRSIPVRYRYDDAHDRYYNLQVQAVTNGDLPLQHEESTDGPNEIIKIGDPNVTVIGAQRYVITYTVQGAMNSFSDHDELFWNVDGPLWPVPKSTVEANVLVPANSLQKTACFQGPPGSTETCTHSVVNDAATFSSTRALGSGEEMSVVVALAKGAVTVPPPMLEERLRVFPQGAFDINPLTVGLFVLVLVAGIGLVAWNWWAHGRDRAYLTQYYVTNDPRDHTQPLFRHDPVAVEFGPPQSMRPAEVGLILDETADAKDVTATIVDLAVRGYLTIAEIPGQKDWQLKWKGADISHLMPYEKTILDGLFAGRTEVKLSELKGTFGPTLRSAEGQIYADAMSRRLFTTNPRQARATWGCVGIALLLAGVAVSVVLGLTLGWGLVGLAIAITGIVLTAGFPFMPQRTAAGRDLMQHSLGFRLYMTTAEKYRLQFAAKAEIFTQLLPYAIVFGCVTLWAKAFEGIDTSASNSWYLGARPFQAAVLASSLESMNANISSALVYAPPSTGSSSGFGGGGFSGGGGGGGGGGAW